MTCSMCERKCDIVACPQEIIEEVKHLKKELEIANNLKKGRVVIKGLAYEDVVGILVNNGYNVQVSVNACKNYSEAYFTIDYQKESCELEFPNEY